MNNYYPEYIPIQCPGCSIVWTISTPENLSKATEYKDGGILCRFCATNKPNPDRYKLKKGPKYL